jgi:hypothetical protein
MPDKDKFEISEGMFASVSTWRGKKRVDIRKWYENKDGELSPGKNGLNIDVDTWNDFVAKWDNIRNHIDLEIKKLKK